MKHRFALFCLILVLCLLPYSALAQTDICEVNMQVSINGEAAYTNGIYTVYGGEQIIVTAGAWAGIDRIGYYLVPDEGDRTETIDVYDDFLSFVLPEYPAGTRVGLYIEAIASNDNGQNNVITKTGWHYYELQYQEKPEVTMTMEFDGTPLSPGDFCFINPGDVISVKAYADAGINRIGYYYTTKGEDTEVVDVYDSSIEITVPDAPSYSYCVLKIEAIANRGEESTETSIKTGWQKIILCYE